ncbi:MAG: hypothetical protein ABI845_09850 [Polaromonas sp.]
MPATLAGTGGGPFKPRNRLSCAVFTLSLYRRHHFHPRFYTRKPKLPSSFLWGSGLMDIIFVLGGTLLWGVMALLVLGFKKLEKPQGGRS